MNRRVLLSLSPACIVGVATLLGSQAAQGQSAIVDDASLGINGGDLIANAGVINIPDNLGQTVGNNLFHSFSKFDVPTSTTAAFQGPNTTQNVIARVTGTGASVIEGTIDTRTAMPSANFFFINPNGITFNAGSTINVGGAVAFSTADQLGFTDAKTFPAAIPVSEVLSSAPVSQFGFTSSQARNIRLTGGAQIGLCPWESGPEPTVVSLVAGNIKTDGGLLCPHDLNLVAAGAPATGATKNITFDPTNGDSLPRGEFTGTLEIVGGSYHDTSRALRYYAGPLTIGGGSLIFANGQDASGAGISIQSTALFNASDAIVSVTGAGNFLLDAESILMTYNDFPDPFGGPGQSPFVEMSTVSQSWLGTQNTRAGDMFISAAKNITIEGWSLYSAANSDNATGNISVNAGGTLRLSEATGAHARVGEITTIAKHGTTPVTGVDDKVGNVSIIARDIELIGAAEIGSASFVDVDEPFANNPNHSPSGDVNVTAHNSLLIDSARPANSQNSGVTGATPGIFSQFPGETKVSLTFNFFPVTTRASGDAGDVNVNVGGTGRLTLMNGGRISSSGSRLPEGTAPSDAGNLNVTANNITIEGQNSGIFAESFLANRGGGGAGGISVKGVQQMRIASEGEISSKSALQLSGNIALTDFAPQAEVRLEGGKLISRSGGDGAAGGNIIIDGPQSLILRDSLINSSATGSGGNGGNIFIRANVLLLQNSFLDASSATGIAGSVTGADIPVNLSDVVTPVQVVPVGDGLTLPEQSAVFQSRDISGHAVMGRGMQPRVPGRYQLEFREADGGDQQ